MVPWLCSLALAVFGQIISPHFNKIGTLGEAGFSSLTHPLPPLLFMVCSRSRGAKGRTVLYWCHGASQQPLLTVSAASGLGQEKLIIEELVKLDVVVIC